MLPKMPERERRWKLIRISEELLIHAVAGFRPGPMPQVQCVIEGLPDGWEAVAIAYEIDRGTFMVRIYHPSFEVVEPGYPTPMADVVLREWTPEPKRGREFI